MTTLEEKYEKMKIKNKLLSKTLRSYKVGYKKSQKKISDLSKENNLLRTKIGEKCKIQENFDELKNDFDKLTEQNKLSNQKLNDNHIIIIQKNKELKKYESTILQYKEIGQDFATKNKVLVLQKTLNEYQEEKFKLNQKIIKQDNETIELKENYKNTFSENIEMRNILQQINSKLSKFLPVKKDIESEVEDEESEVEDEESDIENSEVEDEESDIENSEDEESDIK